MTSMSALLGRINLLSITSAAIGLTSLFLPWWGVDITGVNFNRVPIHWTLWNPPRLAARVAGAQVSWNFALTSLSVLILALLATALVVAGSLTLIRRYLIAGLVMSAATLGAYTIAIEYVTRNACLIAQLCVSGPIGSTSFSGTSGLTVTWGFQSGFYFFLTAIFVLVGGLFLNQSLTRDNQSYSLLQPTVSATYTSSCPRSGASKAEGTRFCSSCG